MITPDEFARQVEAVIQAEPGTVGPDTALTDVPEMDSMGRVSVMDLVDSRFGFVLGAGQFDVCRTVRDLYQHCVARSTRG